MAFERYGGYNWSDQPSASERSFADYAVPGVAAGLGLTVLGFGLATDRPDGSRPMDSVISFARYAGNVSPYQVGNTFRIPELLSPYASNKEKARLFENVTKTGANYEFSFKPFLETLETGTSRFSTHQYLKALSGKTEAELAQLGFSASGMTADDLIFKVESGKTVGSLYSVIGSQHQLVANDIMLQSFSKESEDTLNALNKNKGINRIVHSVMAKMGLLQNNSFQTQDVFYRHEDKARPSHIPIKAELPGRPGTMAAANMDRFNRLVEGFGHQFGIEVKVTSGAAPQMLGRFGKGVMGVGAGIMAIGQLDHARREWGEVGHWAASSATSAGIAWGMSKLKFSGRTQLFTALGSFAGQLMLPGFRQGVVQGIATAGVNLDVMRATAINPANYYRRALEGYLPGVSDWKTGIGIGLGVTAAAGAFGARYQGKPLFSHIMHSKLGIASTLSDKTTKVHTPLGFRDHLWKNMYEHTQKPGFKAWVSPGSELDTVLKELDTAWMSGDGGGWTTQDFRSKVRKAYGLAGIKNKNYHDHYNRMVLLAEDQVQDTPNTVNSALLERLDDLGRKYQGKENLIDRASFFVESVFEQYRHTLAGADINSQLDNMAKQITDHAPKIPLVGRASMLFGGTVLAHQVLTGGLLGSMETSQELSDIYSGKQLVKIGKGRFWEGGGTPFEGTKGYYRPHAYALLMNRTKEKGVWGADDERFGPAEKFMLKNFTHYLEKKNYYDRPYPVSTPAFADIPIIGGLLSSTIGQFFKQSKLMHVSEWTRQGQGQGTQFASIQQGYKREPAYALGASGPGIPSSPYSTANQLSYLNYQMRELSGFTGFVANTASNILFGTDTYGVEGPQLQSSGRMTGWGRRFWEAELGGLGFLSEPLRRIFPNERKEIDKQNPIYNMMPSWIPEQFHAGDPYTSVPWGEARMPGTGYASLHPELQGVDPEDYPLIYQYDILGGIAPFSKEFKTVRTRLYQARAQGQTSSQVNSFIDRIDKMVIDQYNGYDFQRVHDNAVQLPGSGITQGLWFESQKLARQAVAPAEYLIPFGFRPVQKLMSDRDPIERYEHERMYGSSTAFWDKPWRDWLRPSLYSAINFMGYSGKPLWRKEADDTSEYFDQLELVKWMNVAEQARMAGDNKTADRAEYAASQTRMGINPQGNPMGIYWSLPNEDRAFFNAFALAEGKDRKRILEMIPQDQTHLYQALWSRLDAGDPMHTEGPSTPDKAYLQQQYQQALAMTPMPREDWLGWHQEIDLSDIKVKYVNELGRDMHDFGLWEQQLKKVDAQPFLQGSTQFLHDNGGVGRTAIVSDLYDIFSFPDSSLPDIQVNSSPMAFSHMDIQYNDHRDGELRMQLDRYLNGY